MFKLTFTHLYILTPVTSFVSLEIVWQYESDMLSLLSLHFLLCIVNCFTFYFKFYIFYYVDVLYAHFIFNILYIYYKIFVKDTHTNTHKPPYTYTHICERESERDAYIETWRRYTVPNWSNVCSDYNRHYICNLTQPETFGYLVRMCSSTSLTYPAYYFSTIVFIYSLPCKVYQKENIANKKLD